MPDDQMLSYLIPVAGFRVRKAAQLAAFFAGRSPKGEIDKLKLIKLIYLCERQHVTEYLTPMMFDELYSLRNGPICSGTLNGIDQKVQIDVWSTYITRNGNKIHPCHRLKREQMDELSDAEIEIAESTWKKFGHMSASQIRNYTHEHCPEYTETESRVPIAYSDILRAIGDEYAEEIDRDVREIRRSEALLTG